MGNTLSLIQDCIEPKIIVLTHSNGNGHHHHHHFDDMDSVCTSIDDGMGGAAASVNSVITGGHRMFMKTPPRMIVYSNCDTSVMPSPFGDVLKSMSKDWSTAMKPRNGNNHNNKENLLGDRSSEEEQEVVFHTSSTSTGKAKKYGDNELELSSSSSKGKKGSETMWLEMEGDEASHLHHKLLPAYGSTQNDGKSETPGFIEMDKLGGSRTAKAAPLTGQFVEYMVPIKSPLRDMTNDRNARTTTIASKKDSSAKAVSTSVVHSLAVLPKTSSSKGKNPVIRLFTSPVPMTRSKLRPPTPMHPKESMHPKNSKTDVNKNDIEEEEEDDDDDDDVDVEDFDLTLWLRVFRTIDNLKARLSSSIDTSSSVVVLRLDALRMKLKEALNRGRMDKVLLIRCHTSLEEVAHCLDANGSEVQKKDKDGEEVGGASASYMITLEATLLHHLDDAEMALSTLLLDPDLFRHPNTHPNKSSHHSPQTV